MFPLLPSTARNYILLQLLLKLIDEIESSHGVVCYQLSQNDKGFEMDLSLLFLIFCLSSHSPWSHWYTHPESTCWISLSFLRTRKSGLKNVDTHPLKTACKEVGSPFRNIRNKLSYKKSADVLSFKTVLTTTSNFVLKIFSRLLLRKYIAVIVKAFESIFGAISAVLKDRRLVSVWH